MSEFESVKILQNWLMKSQGLPYNEALLEAFQRGERALGNTYEKLGIDRTEERFPTIDVTAHIGALLADLQEVDVYGLGRDADAWQSWINTMVNDFRVQNAEHIKNIQRRPMPLRGRRY